MPEQLVRTEKPLEILFRRNESLCCVGNESLQLVWRQKGKDLRLPGSRHPQSEFGADGTQIPKSPVRMFFHLVLNSLMWVASNYKKIMLSGILGCLLNRLARFRGSPFVLSFAL